MLHSTTQSGFKKHGDGGLDEIKLVRSLLITRMNYPSSDTQAVYGFLIASETKRLLLSHLEYEPLENKHFLSTCIFTFQDYKITMITSIVINQSSSE